MFKIPATFLRGFFVLAVLFQCYFPNKKPNKIENLIGYILQRKKP